MGLVFPCNSKAIIVASLPTTCPRASIKYHSLVWVEMLYIDHLESLLFFKIMFSNLTQRTRHDQNYPTWVAVNILFNGLL